jgi:hypothetical protein
MKVGDLVRKTKKSREHNKIGHLRGIVLEVQNQRTWDSAIAKVFWSADYGTFWTPTRFLEKIA